MMNVSDLIHTLLATAGTLALAPLALVRRKPAPDPLSCISLTGMFLRDKVTPPPRVGVEPTRPWPRPQRRTTPRHVTVTLKVDASEALDQLRDVAGDLAQTQAAEKFPAPPAPELTEMPPIEPLAVPELIEMPPIEPPAVPELIEMPDEALEALASTSPAIRRSTSRAPATAGMPALALTDSVTGWRKRRVGVNAESALLSAWLVAHYPRRINDLASRKTLPILWVKDQAVPRCDASPADLRALALDLGLQVEPMFMRGRLHRYRVTPA